MRPDLLEILRCPIDQGEFQLETTKTDADEIVEGTLTCRRCSEVYPIRETIPRLLPPELRKELEKRLGQT